MGKINLLLLLLLIAGQTEAQPVTKNKLTITAPPDSSEEQEPDSMTAAIQLQQQAIRQHIMDSIKDIRIDEAALMYPRIRQFSITHQENMEGNIRSKLNGKEFFSGRFKSSRTTINMSLPIIDRKQNILVASLGVVHQFFSISDVTTTAPNPPISEGSNYFPMISSSISFTHKDSLFGRAISATGVLSGLFNPSYSRRQFMFTGLITTPLIQNRNTNLIGGVVISIDPTSPIPAFLFLSYFHKFRSLNLDLMIDLPYRVALRKPVLKRASVTAFGELSGNNSFFKLDNPSPGFPEQLTYATLEIKSGLLFEYRLTKKAVLSISGGFNTTATSKVREQHEKPSNAFIKNTNNTVPFLQAGFSLLPFWRPFR